MSSILKQNGINGKIIRAQQTGKVMTQNYNFTTAIRSNFGSGVKIEIPVNIQQGQPFTIGIWVKIDSSGAYFTDNISSSNGVIRMRRQSQTAGFVSYYNNTLMGTHLNGASYPSGLVLMVFDGSVVKYYSSYSLTSTTAIPASVDISRLFINGYSGVAIDKYYEVFVFNRALTLDEIIYKYNNKLFREFLKSVGLTNHYLECGAEIIEIGGVQTIAIRDKSGLGNHAPITGLPAGTLQDQLNYANANMFVTW
ncbi:MAG: hypothetical protein ACWA6U_08035 [Breznakibacter sp.]